jgi:hypothetical protein
MRATKETAKSLSFSMFSLDTGGGYPVHPLTGHTSSLAMEATTTQSGSALGFSGIIV